MRWQVGDLIQKVGSAYGIPNGRVFTVVWIEKSEHFEDYFHGIRLIGEDNDFGDDYGWALRKGEWRLVKRESEVLKDEDYDAIFV